MRIAFFTTLSPIRSALSDYSEGIALAIAEQPGVGVDLFINDDYKPDNAIILERFQIYSHRQFPSRSDDYDLYLYSMGDHGRYHGFMLNYIHRYPGVVILNDLTLHRCIMQSTLLKGDKKAYLAELDYAYGIKETYMANQIQAGLGDHLILEYPLFERVVDSSRGVIVQNQYARGEILAKRPQTNIACIPYPFFMPPGFPEFDLAERRVQQRAKMDMEQDFVIGSFGIFVPNKHLEDCLSAFAYLTRKYPGAKYILGGVPVPDYNLAGHIRGMGLEKNVLITGWSPPNEFVQYMFALDVGIHLRYPHIGGTPYTPIRLMGLGVGTIVSDIEPLAEIPQGACIKIAPDEYQQETLTTLLEYMADNRDFHQQICDNGQAFIEYKHNINDNAKQYVAFLEQLERSM